MLKVLASTRGLGTAHVLGSARELGSAGTAGGKTGPPEVHGLGQLLWDLSLCSPTVDCRAYVLQGNLQVLWLSRSCFLQKIPDLHKNLQKMLWSNC